MLAGDLRRTLGRERWRSDPVAFVREVLVNPETGQPFELYPAQEQFLREGLTLTSEGKLPCPELVFSAPKKSGKTATESKPLVPSFGTTRSCSMGVLAFPRSAAMFLATLWGETAPMG